MVGSKGTANLLTKLNNRQVHGSIADRAVKNLLCNPFGKRFQPDCHSDFQACSRKALWSPARIVFLGFSRCGRFLVTYTQSSELSTLPTAQGLNYVYQLQWWLFRPQEKAKKLAEVHLFGEFVIWHPLYISVNEWPSNPDLVVVFGYDKLEEGMLHNATCYVTVTALPSTDGCRDCRALRKNLGEEYLGCDPGDVLPHAQCLRHGMTVHTSCSVVPPFPKSTPLRLLIPCGGAEEDDQHNSRGVRSRIMKKFVLSTGNFIHAFKVQLLEPVPAPKPRKYESLLFPLFSPPSGWPCNSSGWSQTRERCIAASEASSDVTSIPESIDSRDESMCGSPNPQNLLRTFAANAEPSKFSPVTNRVDDLGSSSVKRRETVGVPMESSRNQEQRPTKFFAGRRAVGGNRSDDAYAFVDESLPASENLSTYRKKRLAERTYEFSDDLFSDENTEASLSVAPWSRRLREPRYFSSVVSLSQGASPGSSGNPALGPFQIRSPTSNAFEVLSVSVSIGGSADAGHPMAVLRQLNHCPSSNLLLSPRELREHRESTEAIFAVGSRSPASSSDHSGVPVRSKTPNSSREKWNEFMVGDGARKRGKTKFTNNPWVAEFGRYYMDADDELVSVLSTDFDDDDLCSSTGYHNALPLEVHGCAYGQMQQVSRSKVGRVGAPIVVFNQISMDMEEFCHRMAEKICGEAGEKYWSCDDFDVAILTQNYGSGSLLCCAEMLVRTTHRHLRNSTEGKLYSTGLTFEWHPWKGEWRVVTCKPLLAVVLDDEFRRIRSHWLPAQNMVRVVNREWNSTPTNPNALPRRMDNLPVLQERSLEYIREPSLGVEVKLRTRMDQVLLSEDSDIDSDLPPSPDDDFDA